MTIPCLTTFLSFIEETGRSAHPSRGTDTSHDRVSVRRRSLPFIFALTSILNSLVLFVNVASSADDVRKTRDEHVRTLFQKKCVRCHGEKTRKGDLDLSNSIGIAKGGES
ncbi:MAG: hypothetical protein FJ267_10220, partial [Planctomycetes bacterium]|nr:hypothetical protein [Planctomycetota bacterium]